MKSMTCAFVLLAAAAAVQVMKAEGPASFTAPFAFQTPSGLMPSGKYEVEVRATGSASKIVMLRHQATNQRNLFVSSASPGGVGAASIDFQCINADDCRLERVTLRSGAYPAMSKSRWNEKLYSIVLGAGSKPKAE